MNPAILSRLSCWADRGTRLAAVSVVAKAGSTPHAPGLAMLVNESGEVAGAVSGGCVDGALVGICDEVLATSRSQSVVFEEAEGLLSNPGFICGGSLRVWAYELKMDAARALSGESSGRSTMRLIAPPGEGPLDEPIAVEVLPNDDEGLPNRTDLITRSDGKWEFRERFGTRDLLVIVGQSGFTDALCRQGTLLGYEVVVCEPRGRFGDALESATRVDRRWPDECLRDLDEAGKLDQGAAVIVCTHDSKFDEPALLAALGSGAGFIGAMGSRRTVTDRRERLLALGVDEREISRIRSPLGLDLGAITPAETAISVFAELLASRRGREAGALRNTNGPIHTPDHV